MASLHGVTFEDKKQSSSVDSIKLSEDAPLFVDPSEYNDLSKEERQSKTDSMKKQLETLKIN